jgi:hypothetical protein
LQYQCATTFPNPKAKRKNFSSLPSSSLQTRLLKAKEKKTERKEGQENKKSTQQSPPALHSQTLILKP